MLSVEPRQGQLCFSCHIEEPAAVPHALRAPGGVRVKAFTIWREHTVLPECTPLFAWPAPALRCADCGELMGEITSPVGYPARLTSPSPEEPPWTIKRLP